MAKQRFNANVDVSDVLTKGAKYEVRNAQNFLGKPVLSGTYHGTPLSLPMKNLAVAQPFDPYPVSPEPTWPEFAVFVLLQVRS
jgi:hypothetical protein